MEDSKKNELICHANEVLNLKLISKSDDVEKEEKVFHPKYTHQIFPRKDENTEDDEIIEGFKDLKIDLYFIANTLKPYLNITFSESNSTVEIVENPIKSKLQDIEIFNNLDMFLKTVEKDLKAFHPPGTLIHSYRLDTGELEPNSIFEVYKGTFEDSMVKELHKHFQIFALLLIDASSFIDQGDDKWEVYFLMKKMVQNGEPVYHSVGYTTVYRFFNYPDKIRKRISQVVVLPPFQRQGHGAMLLKTIYDSSKEDKIRDITVEDPSPEFTVVRDCVDVEILLQNGFFTEKIPLQPIKQELLNEIRDKLKLSPDQIKHIHEIFLYYYTDKQDAEQYKQFRHFIKKRLYLKYRDILSGFEISNDRKKELDSIYKAQEAQFDAVVQKIKKHLRNTS